MSVEELLEKLKEMPPLSYVAICQAESVMHDHRTDRTLISVERGRNGVVVLTVGR